VDRDLNDHLLVKTRINFPWNDRRGKMVAQLRDYTHRQNLFYCPGIAFRKELKNLIGGHFFNDQVWWSDDAEMNHRIQKAGLPFYREEGVSLTHDPESMQHDLRGADKLGRGKFAQVMHAGRDTYEEHIIPLLKRMLSGESAANILKIAQQESIPTALYSILWQAVYLYGYHREKIRHLLGWRGN